MTLPGPADRSTPTVVFIGGYMHSGTTLIGELIGNFEGAFRPENETKLLEFLSQFQELYPRLDEPGQLAGFRSLCRRLLADGFSAELLRRPADAEDEAPAGRGRQGAGDHFDVFLEEAGRLLREKNNSILVEHSGTSIFAYRELAASGADVYLVDIVRDPRDVLASKKTRRATVFTDRYRADQQRRKHFEKSFDPFWDTLSWRSFIRAGDVASCALAGRYLRVRYEDLVTDPGHELRRIADLLRVESPTADALKVETANPADTTTVRTGVDARSVGRWAQVLSDGEARVCTSAARQEIRYLGYAPEPVGLRLSMVRPLSHAAAEPVVRVYRRYRLLGTAGVRAIVGNYAMRLRRSRAGG